MTDQLAGPTWLLNSRCLPVLGISLASGGAVVQLVQETRRAMHNQGGGIGLNDRVGCRRPMVGVISGGDSEHFDPFLVKLRQ